MPVEVVSCGSCFTMFLRMICSSVDLSRPFCMSALSICLELKFIVKLIVALNLLTYLEYIKRDFLLERRDLELEIQRFTSFTI